MDSNPAGPEGHLDDDHCLHDLGALGGGAPDPRVKAALDEISPSGTWLETEALEPKDLPALVRARFDSIAGYALPDEIPELEDLPDEDAGSDVEDFDGREEVTVARVLGIAQGIYRLGLHDPDAPFNPSGYDFYVRADGSYLGWMES